MKQCHSKSLKSFDPFAPRFQRSILRKKTAQTSLARSAGVPFQTNHNP